MLLQLREWIEKEGVVSMQQLTRVFRMDEAALQPMLDIWIKKGVIKPCQEKSACQTRCFRCKINQTVYYQRS